MRSVVFSQINCLPTTRKMNILQRSGMLLDLVFLLLDVRGSLAILGAGSVSAINQARKFSHSLTCRSDSLSCARRRISLGDKSSTVRGLGEGLDSGLGARGIISSCFRASSERYINLRIAKDVSTGSTHSHFTEPVVAVGFHLLAGAKLRLINIDVVSSSEILPPTCSNK